MGYYQVLGRPAGSYAYPRSGLAGLAEVGGKGIKSFFEAKKKKQMGDIYRKAAEKEGLVPEFKVGPGGEITTTYKQAEPFDPGTVLDTLELQNVMKKLKERVAGPAADLSRGLGEPYTPPAIPTIEKPVEPIIEPTRKPIVTKGAPEAFIQVKEGIDKYGNVEYKTVTNPKYDIWLKEQEGRFKAKAETLKMGEKAKASFKSIVAMFSGLVAQTKAQQEEQKGLGLIPGAKGKLGVTFKRPEFARTAAAYGQRVETAMRMNSILTGQNRVIRSVVAMIFKSLPGQYDPDPTVAAKMAQSVTNAYKITKAWERAGLSEAELAKAPTSTMKIDGKTIQVIDIKLPEYMLSKKEKAELDKIIDDVLATPMMKPRKLIESKKEMPAIGGTYKGEKIIDVERIE